MDDLSREELNQLMAMFRHQSLEILDGMNQDLLALEAGGLNEEVICRVRRAAHTIKGDAACVDLNGVTEVAHKMEDLFDQVLSDVRKFNPEIVDVILAGLDAIRAALEGDEVRDLAPDEVGRICARFNAPELLAPEQGENPGTADPEVRCGVVVEDAPAPAASVKAAAARQDYVRVDAGVIDALMNLAGEMIIASSVMNQVGVEIADALPKSDVARNFGGVQARLNKLIAELQKSVLEMRMVPISQLFRRFNRSMRELAGETGKQLELVTAGEETELDRSVVDLLYEPLLHLLRNAVDHGLETTEQRVAAGKPAAGTVRLAAYHEGNQIVVEVADDGRGIDVEALRAKATATGELSASESSALPDDEAMNLIFLPGLSTAKEITFVSGRGVGMAAVKSAIEHLRGTINVRSEKGRGTTFTLRLPLTLAVIRALLFTTSGRLYALPLLSTSEISQTTADAIQHVDGVETWRLRDQWVSLIRPGVVLKHERRRGGKGARLRPADEAIFVVMLKSGNMRFGVIADEVLGEQELVIKPLDTEWLQSDVLAGASVLGDGRVVLILDANMLIRKAARHERDRAAGIGIYTTG
ncbi:MAG TPA: chemotaxis protein CheA [Blastocatellia bacterium]|nr:chemotaxis protein CheA [Blastocatellia bacterium]